MGIISKITDWVTTPYTIYLILKDPTISQSVKLRSVIGLVLIFAYIVSPIDIIPDFIPMSGWLDDLVVVPLGLALMRKFIPDIGVLERRGEGTGKRQANSPQGYIFDSDSCFSGGYLARYSNLHHREVNYRLSRLCLKSPGKWPSECRFNIFHLESDNI